MDTKDIVSLYKYLKSCYDSLNSCVFAHSFIQTWLIYDVRFVLLHLLDATHYLESVYALIHQILDIHSFHLIIVLLHNMDVFMFGSD